jgi:2-desacetyl-2-hydroxyethyl bacteriochlorophyllide A dehydrogenase
MPSVKSKSSKSSPSNQTKRQSLAFTAKQKVILEEQSVGTPGKGEVLFQTQYTLMSTGTENIVFNRLFEPGSHWDKWVEYPFYPGYCAVGIVKAIGPDVAGIKVGDHIACRAGHSSHHISAAESCFLIPKDIDMKEAVWFGLAKIAFMGAKAAQHFLGDSVLVIGAGPIGQMALRWAVASGAQSVIVIDSVEKRLVMAKKGGATATISVSLDKAEEEIKKANGGKPVRVVIDSTGNAQVFSKALTLADKYGKVVILGDTGSPSQQNLSPDVITRGLTIVGAHDMHNDQTWNNQSVAQLLFSLIKTRRFSLEGLNTHVFDPKDCTEAYTTANTKRPETMGIIFDWTKY